MAREAKGIILSQRKYILGLLTGTGMLGCKPIISSINPKSNMNADVEQVYRDRHQRLVGKLI